MRRRRFCKFGAAPWRLKRETTNELIVGVGTLYSMTCKSKYVGSAFCFNKESIFKGFDCFGANDTDSIASSISEALVNSSLQIIRLPG